MPRIKAKRVTFETLRALNDRAHASEKAKAEARRKARRLAEKLGVDPPPWAKPQLPWRAAKPPPPPPPSGAIAVPCQIPVELSAWRARHQADGSIVRVHTGGVELITMLDTQRFTSVAAAIRAVS